MSVHLTLTEYIQDGTIFTKLKKVHDFYGQKINIAGILCNDVERRISNNGSTFSFLAFTLLANAELPAEASLSLRLVDASTGAEIFPNKVSVHVQLFAPSASALPPFLSRGEPVLLRGVKAKLSQDNRPQCIAFDADPWTGFVLKMVHRPGAAADVVLFKGSYPPAEEEKRLCADLYKWNRCYEDVDSPAVNTKKEVCLKEIRENLNWDAVVEVSLSKWYSRTN